MNKADIKAHFESIADRYDYWKAKNSYYHDTLKAFYASHIKRNARVIEFACGTGGIIGVMPGRERVGLDISHGMIARARRKFPAVTFHVHDAEEPLPGANDFDVAILADVVDHITDVLKLYQAVNASLRLGGRMCLSTINPLWDPIFAVAERLDLKMPEGPHNFLPNRDLINMLQLTGFRLVRSGAKMLVPRRIPLLSDPINRVAEALPIVNRLCAIQTLVAEKVHDFTLDARRNLTVSVVIPCHNEEGNVAECARRTPDMGAGTEILFVNDGSTDGTADAVREVMKADPRVRLITCRKNRGKGNAVKLGFDRANGDVLMILDADMTVMPEELPLFYKPIADGLCDFANGTRLVYPMEQQAMRFANLLGNFAFSVIMTWLLRQRVSDTLCGTKCLLKADYKYIRMGGDPWGDFDLLFGAAEENLKILEVPVHYRARTAGQSKMRPLRHAAILLKRCWQGFLRLKLKRR